MTLIKANKQWDDDHKFLLLAALEVAQKMNYTNVYIASQLHNFLGRTEKAVEIKLNELSKPVGYEPKKRTTKDSKQQQSEVDNDIVNIIVLKVVSYGAFCVTEDGKSNGLLHISKIANHFIDDITKYVAEGDTLKVRIKQRHDGKIDFFANEVSPLVPKQNLLKVSPLAI